MAARQHTAPNPSEENPSVSPLARIDLATHELRQAAALAVSVSDLVLDAEDAKDLPLCILEVSLRHLAQNLGNLCTRLECALMAQRRASPTVIRLPEKPDELGADYPAFKLALLEEMDAAGEDETLAEVHQRAMARVRAMLAKAAGTKAG